MRDRVPIAVECGDPPSAMPPRPSPVVEGYHRRMGYRTLAECVIDLECAGQLVPHRGRDRSLSGSGRDSAAPDAAGGPAIYFARVRGTAFPMVSNLFGTLDRLRYMFRDTLAAVSRLVELKVRPQPGRAGRFGTTCPRLAALHMLPRRVRRGADLRMKPRSTVSATYQFGRSTAEPFVTLP